MLHISGVVQLAAVVKEDETKNKDKIVFFTAFTRRGDKDDKVFCKVYGNTAEYLIRNLVRKDDGSYKSRKLYIAGNIETYKQTKPVNIPKVVPKSALPPQLGVLKEDITIHFTKEMEEDKMMIKVSFLEFEDKKKESETIEIYRGDGSSDKIVGSYKKETKEQTQHSSLIKEISEASEGLNSIVMPTDLGGIV